MKSVVVVTLLLFGALSVVPDEVFARAGSGGSRGSRSFSSPARPSSPTIPSNPSRTVTSPQPTQPSAARPGFGGGWLGGLAGFALGGLLGGLLFGGLGHGWGGIGLFDLVLIGGALFLLFRVMSRRREMAYAAAGGGPEVARYTAETPAAAPASSDLERGLAHIRQMDGGFDPAAVEAHARTVFGAVQSAVRARDVAPVASLVTSRMFTELGAQCDRLRGARQTNHLESIAISRAEVSEAWQEGGQDYVTVYLIGSLVDYTVEDASGRLVDGSPTPQAFEEFWTFTRSVGPNPWKLTAIQTG